MFEKSKTEIETYESFEEKQYPQEYDSNQSSVNILDGLIEKEKDDQRVLAMFKHSIRNNISVFIISRFSYELPKKTIRANGNKHQIVKPNN